jgi:predicted nucleotidyltransferase
MVKDPVVTAAELLRNIFKHRRLKLNKLVLFGSYAAKKNTKFSDIDLIIVSKDFRKKTFNQRVKLMKGLNRSLVYAINKPVDIFYFSDEEWKQGNSLIISEAKSTGKVL